GGDAGQGGESGLLARAHHLEVEAGADGEGGAELGGGFDGGGIEHGAGTHLLTAFAPGGDHLGERLTVGGGLERDLDGVDAEVPGGAGELEAALDAHAAQDRHQGRGGEGGVEVLGAVRAGRGHGWAPPAGEVVAGVGRSWVLARVRAARAWPRVRRSAASWPVSRPANEPAAKASPAPTASTISMRGVGTALRRPPSNSTASMSASLTTRCGTSGNRARTSSAVAVPHSAAASSRPTRTTSAFRAAARISCAASPVVLQRAGRWLTSKLTSAPWA